MARSFPIWHAVSACHYKSNKSYGGMNTSEDKILVGSSAQNSHELAHIITTRRFFEDDNLGKVCVFRLSVDMIVLKEMWFKDNNGKAGEWIKTVSYLPDE